MNVVERAAVAAMVLTASALAAITSPPPAAAETARSADAFVESIGVNVHLSSANYSDTPYLESFSTVEQRLEELGIHHVRAELLPASPEIDQAIRSLASRGIKSTLILGSPAEEEEALPEMLATLKAELVGSLDAVEGPNEYSTSGDSEWKAHLVAYQERLYAGVKNDPALASLPVIGPSIVHGDQATLGDISSSLDFGNIHSYPEGGPPESKVDQFIQRAAYNSASKPIVATETGYTNALNWTPSGPGENRPASEAAAGVYTPRLFLEYWNRGIVRTFYYELVDEYADPGLEEREDHFGLLRNDLSEKPAAIALGNMIRILEDPGPEFVAQTLEYSLGGGAPLHDALFEKRDGSFYLALWRLESVWNPETKEPLEAAPEPETVALPSGIGGYAIYEPSVSSKPVAIGGPTASVTTEVGPGVTIVRLDPAAPPTTDPEPPSPPASSEVSGSPATSESPLASGPPRSAPSCTVPKLRGLTLSVARQRLRRADCSVKTTWIPARRATGPGSGKPTVEKTRPGAGSARPAGSKIEVFVRRPQGSSRRPPPA